MVDALCKELEQRAGELSGTELSSIYFGGGTPSLLSQQELGSIMDTIAKYYTWQAIPEITLEANPDDITPASVAGFLALGINRFSVGVQSFSEADLQFMNRAHTATEAMTCIDVIKNCGCDNITADLIYGSPTTSTSTWQSNIAKLLSYDLPHISAYCLTVEEGTALHHFVKTGAAQPVDSDRAIEQFDILIDQLHIATYEHYEISNFAKSGYRAIHNTNYWRGVPYLGIGPGAHSYDGEATRRWNIAHNPKYMAAIQHGDSYHEAETLSPQEQYNEYILTALRTSWGIDKEYLAATFATHWQQVEYKCQEFLAENILEAIGHSFRLTRKGKHLADHISMQLFSS